jgi:hypothetical protein
MLNSPLSTPKNRAHAQKLRFARPLGATINQPTYTSEPPKSTNVHKPPMSAKPPPNSMPPNSTATRPAEIAWLPKQTATGRKPKESTSLLIADAT